MKFPSARMGILFENRSLRQTVTKNAFWLLVGQFATRTLKFVVTAYAARLLGVEAIGSLAYASALTTLSFTFSDVGVSTLLVREYQHAKNRGRLLWTLFKAKLGFVALSICIAAAAFTVFGGRVPFALLLLMLGVTTFDVTRDLFVAIARAKEKTQWEAAILAVEGSATLVFCLGALFAVGTVIALAGGYLLASITAFSVAVILFIREFRGASGEDEVALRKLLRDIWPFAIAAAIAVAFTQADTAILGWLRGPHDAGLYGAGSRIMQILLTLPALIGTSLLPALSRFREEAARQATAVREALAGVMLFAVPLAFGGIAIATPVIVLVYGQAFAGGGTAFALLLASFFCFAITTILDFLLLSRNLQAKNFAYTATAAVLGLALDVVLIPRYGPAGAGVASLCAQLLNLGLTMRLARKTLGHAILSFSDTVRIGLAGAVMAYAVTWLQIATVPRVAFGAGVYALMLLILRPPFAHDLWKRLRNAAAS